MNRQQKHAWRGVLALLGLLFGMGVGTQSTVWADDCRHPRQGSHVCQKIVRIREFQPVQETNNLLEIYLEVDRQNNPISVQYLKNGGLGDVRRLDDNGSPYYIYERCEFASLVAGQTCNLDRIHSAILISLSQYQSQENQQAQAAQQQNRPAVSRGGSLAISYLRNGITGRRSYISLYMGELRDTGRWALFPNDSAAPLQTLSIYANYSRFLNRVIGIQSIQPE
jgi:hypothetical protein